MGNVLLEPQEFSDRERREEREEVDNSYHNHNIEIVNLTAGNIVINDEGNE